MTDAANESQTPDPNLAHAQFLAAPVEVLDAAHGMEGVSVTSPGQINKRLAEALAIAIPEQVIADGIQSLINAKRMTKHGVEVDIRAREAGLKLALAYRVGLPVTRSEIVNVNLDAVASDDLEARMAKAPALRKALRDMLAKFED